MEYGDAVKALQDRGYTVEWSTDDTRVIRVTNRAGETLKDPTSAELVQLATGRTVQSVRESRNSN